MPSSFGFITGFILLAVVQPRPLHGLTKHPDATHGGEPLIEMGLNATSVNLKAAGLTSMPSLGSPSLRVAVSNRPETALTTERHWHGFNFEAYPEISVAYAVRFPDNFSFVHGGRLPGIVGGATNAAQSCLNGLYRTSDVSRESCFSLHPAWRSDGSGTVYLVIYPRLGSAIVPGARSEGTVVIPPDINFQYPRSAWTQLTLRVRLNTPGMSDGALQLSVNGTRVLCRADLELRAHDASRFRGVDLATFSYGPTTPSTQRITLARFAAAALFDGSEHSPEHRGSSTTWMGGWKSLAGACAILMFYFLFERCWQRNLSGGITAAEGKAP